MSIVIPAGALAERPLRVSTRPFMGTVIFRQVRAGHRLWRPSTGRHRWSEGFPALYASLELGVAFAERIKYVGPVPTDLEVGQATVTIRWIVDLTDGQTLNELGVTAEELTSDANDRALPRRIGTELYKAGATALLVPAAIALAARIYPRYRIERERRPVEIHAMPRGGTNLVVSTKRMRKGDLIQRDKRSVFRCRLQALTG